MRFWIRIFAVLAVLATASPAAAVDDCADITMTVTASFPNDPGFEGLWKYCVTGSWDVTNNGLSHIDFFLALKNLECICDPGIVSFPDPAGSSTGEGCTSYYEGIYQCMGDPSIPAELRAPTIKFEHDECEPGVSGTGTWCFYSPLPPAPPTLYEDAVAIKHGPNTCIGDLFGEMPIADCSTPAAPMSWGAVKAQYR
ncbi:MAG: hypothetical protein ACREOU_12415 [Candidatus Eiseniibacteriota bacterium]